MRSRALLALALKIIETLFITLMGATFPFIVTIAVASPTAPPAAPILGSGLPASLVHSAYAVTACPSSRRAQLCWPGGATPLEPPLASGLVPLSRGLGPLRYAFGGHRRGFPRPQPQPGHRRG